MSKTSDRVTRMLALIPYLKENPRIEVSEVARKFSVSEQTIESDVIKLFMCGLPRGLPDDLIEIDYDALKNDGIIEIRNADFINRPVKILQSEAFSTLVALETLRASATSPEEIDLIKSVNEKLRAAFIDSPETNISVHTDEVDPDLTAVINEAINRQKCLRIDYLSPHKLQATVREIEPITLRSRQGHHYLHAFCLTENEIRIFRLDRINSCETTERPIEERAEIEIAEEVYVPREEDNWADFAITGEVNWLLEKYPMGVVRPAENDNADYKQILRMWSVDETWLVRFALRNADVLRIIGPEHLVQQATAEARLALSAYDGEAN